MVNKRLTPLQVVAPSRISPPKISVRSAAAEALGARQNAAIADWWPMRSGRPCEGDFGTARCREPHSVIRPLSSRWHSPIRCPDPNPGGTSLGLSMSHDIVVKQRGGTIDVETEPGRFTEFIIVLPRTNGFQNKN